MTDLKQQQQLILPDSIWTSCVEERETTINFSRDQKMATIYTSDNTVLTKLKHRIASNPEAYILTHVYKTGDVCTGIEVTCDKKLINFRRPRAKGEAGPEEDVDDIEEADVEEAGLEMEGPEEDVQGRR